MDAGGQALTALFTFVLAGLLGPSEFGVLALAMVYVLFIDMLQRQGLASAIIQRKELAEAHLDAAFWMMLGASALLTMGSIALAGWWAAVNDTPQLQPVIVALSFLLPVHALILVQDALFRRSLRFRELALRNNVAAAAGGICGVTAALGGIGVWALVVQQLVSAIVALALLWRVAQWRPRWQFSASALRDLMSFSAGAFLTSVAVFVNNRSDALLTGLFFGPVAIGLYRFAYRLLDQVIALSLSGRSLASVALSELSRHQDDNTAFSERVDTLMHVSVVSAFPLLGILAATATPLLAFVGDDWVPAANAVRALCIVGAVRALVELVGPVLQARGHPHRQAALTWMLGMLSAGSYVAVGIWLRGSEATTQVLSMALSRAAVYAAVLAPLALWIFNRYGRLSPSRVFITIAPPATAALAGCAAGLLTGQLLPTGDDRMERLVALLGTGAVAAVITVIVLVGIDRRARPQLRALWTKGRLMAKGLRTARAPARGVNDPEIRRQPLDPMSSD